MVTHEHQHDASRKVIVTRGRIGWDVTEERNRQVVRRATYTDWHRVERALETFRREADGHPYSTNL